MVRYSTSELVNVLYWGVKQRLFDDPGIGWSELGDIKANWFALLKYFGGGYWKKVYKILLHVLLWVLRNGASWDYKTENYNLFINEFLTAASFIAMLAILYFWLKLYYSWQIPSSGRYAFIGLQICFWYISVFFVQ